MSSCNHTQSSAGTLLKSVYAECANYTVFLFVNGVMSAETLLERAVADNEFTTWMLRFGGSLLCWVCKCRSVPWLSRRISFRAPAP